MTMLGDTVRAALPELQREAESLMTLTLTAFEPSGTTKDADGYDVQGYTSRGTTIGKLQSGTAQGKDANTRYTTIGEVERPVLEGGLHIPLTATLPEPGWQRGLGWEYEITAVNGLADISLLGRRFLVVEVPAKSFATARRLNVVEVS